MQDGRLGWQNRVDGPRWGPWMPLGLQEVCFVVLLLTLADTLDKAA